MIKKLLNCFILAVFMISGIQLIQAQTEHAKLVEKLIKVTAADHPFRQELKDLIKLPETPPELVAEKFDPALAANTQLTAEQKQFVKANSAKLARMVNEKMLVISTKYLKFSDWLTAFLTQTYPQELTAEEMQTWLTYFESSEGQLVLKAILPVPQPTDPESRALLQKFETTPIGIKFIGIFGEALNTYVQAKMGEVEATVKGEFEKLKSPDELNKLFNQFVAENFKKQ